MSLADLFVEILDPALETPTSRENENDPGLEEIHRRALAAMERHPWPGNVRELKNVIEHAAAICPGGAIHAEHLPLTAGASRCGASDRRLRLRSLRLRDAGGRATTEVVLVENDSHLRRRTGSAEGFGTAVGGQRARLARAVERGDDQVRHVATDDPLGDAFGHGRAQLGEVVVG